MKYTNAYYGKLKETAEILKCAGSVMIGAGAGLSVSAGFIYTGERFNKYFHDFSLKYGFNDMYSGGFYPYETLEEYWAYWSRYIYINRYTAAPKPVYNMLYDIIKDKDYFVLTTNVDHCFQKAGFDKERLFYTQGDYGLIQCSKPCHKSVYDNENIIKKMVKAQGYIIKENSELTLPEGITPKMSVPSELIPRCPICNRPMTMNLRADASFAEDEGWHKASNRYGGFLEKHKDDKAVYLELGVGSNTPGIIKYPFWQLVYNNPKSVYVCLNYGEASAPDEIKDRAILFNNDIGEILEELGKIGI